MKLAVAQHNPIIGDIIGNLAKIKATYNAFKNDPAVDLVLFPELAVSGYSPRDLLLRPAFVGALLSANDTLRDLTTRTNGNTAPALLIGNIALADSPTKHQTLAPPIHNSAWLFMDGKVIAVHHKLLLPNYDIFDEERYFVAGNSATVVLFNHLRIGISVCEDLWNGANACGTPNTYQRDPIQEQVDAGVDLLINLSASPFEQKKPQWREQTLSALCKKYAVPLLYVNQTGGNDSILFDGSAAAYSANGVLQFRSPFFPAHSLKADTRILTFTVNHKSKDKSKEPSFIAPIAPFPSAQMLLEGALITGIRDYFFKSGLTKAVIGLSGGIDSAVTAVLACKALGSNHVIGVTMPSRYSSTGAADDATKLANRLGMKIDTLSIEPLFRSFLESLDAVWGGLPNNVTEENLQARIRGTLLMAYSNKIPGALLLSTGNKSEIAVGYCTLYGDMCGSLAVIGDLYKTEVYQLAHHLNQSKEGQYQNVIPAETLTKPPSAELRPDQTDADSLPDYRTLDTILCQLIEEQQEPHELIRAGFSKSEVDLIWQLVQRNEYKRSQSAPILKVTGCCFGEGRRVPLATRYSIPAL